METEKLKTQVLRARTGDLEAYSQIVRRFQDMAYGYGYAVLGDFHLAQDAAQEAFVQAYRDLHKLSAPAAFPGWFRKIVLKHCNRITRRKHLPTTQLEAAAGAAAKELTPAQTAEKREMQQQVLQAIRSLPEHQRLATTLFYINGYSQNDIAEFLEVPVTTIKKRLHDSRNRLKERMIGMVEETLHQNAPDERFSTQVIEDLLARPRPLEIEGHPVREVWDLMRLALPEYEVIQGEEIVPVADELGLTGNTASAYPVDNTRVLRTSTTITTLRASADKEPPVHLLTAGRVFRAGSKGFEEDAMRLKVFHQADGLCIDAGSGPETMKASLEGLMQVVFAPKTMTFQWQEAEFPCFKDSLELSIRTGNKWVEVAACGMLSPKSLREARFDPRDLSGFAFGMGLERLAMLRHGIDDIRKLWQPPYVPT